MSKTAKRSTHVQAADAAETIPRLPDGRWSRDVGRSGARLFLLAACLVAVPVDAHAYLDPGTGGLVLQMLVGGLLAVGVTAKMWWGKVKSIIFRSRREPKPTDRTDQ